MEDVQTIQSALLSSPVAEDKLQLYESDEDIEVDIDGSDSEELNTCLIPGKQIQCFRESLKSVLPVLKCELQQQKQGYYILVSPN